jgi:hypothetical protein
MFDTNSIQSQLRVATKSRSHNHSGLAHSAAGAIASMVAEQYAPVRLSALQTRT